MTKVSNYIFMVIIILKTNNVFVNIFSILKHLEQRYVQGVLVVYYLRYFIYGKKYSANWYMPVEGFAMLFAFSSFLANLIAL